MKNKNLLVRISDEDVGEINKAFKKELINSDLVITRSEFIRMLIKEALKKYKEN